MRGARRKGVVGTVLSGHSFQAAGQACGVRGLVPWDWFRYKIQLEKRSSGVATLICRLMLHLTPLDDK